MSNTAELISEAEVCIRLGGADKPISPTTLWRGMRSGAFPRPVRIGAGTRRWLAGEVDAVIERAASARPGVRS